MIVILCKECKENLMEDLRLCCQTQRLVRMGEVEGKMFPLEEKLGALVDLGIISEEECFELLRRLACDFPALAA